MKLPPKKTGRWVGVLLAICLCIGALQAAADDPAGQRDIDFSAAFRMSYTDNRDAEREEEDNFAISIKPRIRALLDRRRGWLDFYYAPAYRYWSNPSELQNETELHHDVGLSASYFPVRRIRLRLKDVYGYTDDPAIQDEGTTIREDGSYMFNRGEALLGLLLTKRTSLEITGRNTIKRYEAEDIRDDANEDMSAVSAAFKQEVAERLFVFAGAESTAFDYETSYDLERGFDVVSYFAGVDRQFSKFWSAAIRAGSTTLEYDDEELGSRDAPYGNLSAVLMPEKTTRISLGAAYALRESDVYPFASQQRTQFSTKLSHEIGRSGLSVGLGAVYGRGVYEADMVSSSAPDESFVDKREGVEIMMRVGGEIKYSVGDKYSVKLGQSYEDVSSDVDVDFDRNVTFLELFVRF